MGWFRRNPIAEADPPTPAAALMGEPLPSAVLLTTAELEAFAERLASELVERHAADEFHGHIADRLFDEMFHDASLALAAAIGEQVRAEDRLVDRCHAEWLRLRARSHALAVDVDRLRRLRDHHHERITGLPAPPESLLEPARPAPHRP